MTEALSVLLPIYNSHHRLEPEVEQVLEVLPEFSSVFRLCIVDDGSTDDSAEVARELAARYPQVSMLRHPARLGLAEAIQTGIDQTNSEIILVSDDAYQLEPEDLRTMWQLRDAERRLTSYWAALARHESGKASVGGQPKQLLGERGLHIIRRPVFDQFRLEQAVEIVRRVDRGAASQKPASPVRPPTSVRMRRWAHNE